MKKLWESLLVYVDVFVLFACLFLVFGIWYWGVNNDDFSDHLLDENSQMVRNGIDNHFEHMFDYVGAIKGLFEATESVTQKEFSAFVKAMMGGGDEYDHLLRFIVFEKVDNTDIEEFKKNFEITHKKENYVLVANSEYQHQFVSVNATNGIGDPVVPTGQNLLMFDDKKNFLNKVDNGNQKFVELLPSVINIEEYNRQVVVIGLPIIREGEMYGFVAAYMSVDGLVKEVDSWQGKDIVWKWTWNDVLIASGESDTQMNRGVYEGFELDVDDGEKLKFSFETEKIVSGYWNWVLGFGVLMSFVVYGMVYVLLLSGVKTKEMAEEMTKDLAKFKLAIDSNYSHVIITDTDGKIVYANDSVTRLTGYPREEIIGQTPRLWGKQMSEDFYKNFWETIKVKRQVFRGEVTNMRKSGEKYIAEAIVSPILSEEGALLGFVGVERDVTARKQNEDYLQKHTEEVEKLNDLMVDRELKMVEMKKELDKLRAKNESLK